MVPVLLVYLALLSCAFGTNDTNPTFQTNTDHVKSDKVTEHSTAMPVKVFLSMRNMTSEDDETEMEPDVSKTTAEERSDELGNSTGRVSRDTGGSVHQFPLFVPHKHKKIDTAELSDCALQGDWHPIGAPRAIQQTPEVPNIQAHLIDLTIPQHLTSNLHVVNTNYLNVSPPPPRELEDAYLSPPPLPQQSHRFDRPRKHKKTKPTPHFVHATISEVPVSEHLHHQPHHQVDLGTSFTCGKNHDHGTNYHTASFQVVGEEEPNQFAQASFTQNVAVPYPGVTDESRGVSHVEVINHHSGRGHVQTADHQRTGGQVINNQPVPSYLQSFDRQPAFSQTHLVDQQPIRGQVQVDDQQLTRGHVETVEHHQTRGQVQIVHHQPVRGQEQEGDQSLRSQVQVMNHQPTIVDHQPSRGHVQVVDHQPARGHVQVVDHQPARGHVQVVDHQPARGHVQVVDHQPPRGHVQIVDHEQTRSQSTANEHQPSQSHLQIVDHESSLNPDHQSALSHVQVVNNHVEIHEQKLIEEQPQELDEQNSPEEQNYAAENLRHTQQQLAESFPRPDYQEDALVDSSAPESAQTNFNEPYNPWNEEYQTTPADSLVEASQDVSHRLPKQDSSAQTPDTVQDQSTEANGHSYFYEIGKVSRYPNTQPYKHSHLESSFEGPPEANLPYNHAFEEQQKIIKELEHFTNELTQKNKNSLLPGSTHSPLDDYHSSYHDDFNFNQHENQIKSLDNDFHHHDFPTHDDYHDTGYHDDHQQVDNPDLGYESPPYTPSLEYKSPYVPPAAPHSSSYEPHGHHEGVSLGHHHTHDAPLEHLHHLDVSPLIHEPLSPPSPPVFSHNSHSSANIHDSPLHSVHHNPDDNYRKVNHVNVQYVSQMQYHHKDEPHAIHIPPRVQQFKYTVRHSEPTQTQFNHDTQPIFANDPVRLHSHDVRTEHPFNIHTELTSGHPESYINFGSHKPFTYKVNDKIVPFPSLPISADDVHTPNHDKPKVHKNPKRKQHPKKQYEVHENSGEKQRPVSEIFPPKKMPKQFNMRTPNFAVNRPKGKGKAPRKPGPYFVQGSEIKSVRFPPGRSKNVQRQKSNPRRPVQGPSHQARLRNSPGADRTVKVNSVVDPTKKQMIARVVEFSAH